MYRRGVLGLLNFEIERVIPTERKAKE